MGGAAFSHGLALGMRTGSSPLTMKSTLLSGAAESHLSGVLVLSCPEDMCARACRHAYTHTHTENGLGEAAPPQLQGGLTGLSITCSGLVAIGLEMGM